MPGRVNPPSSCMGQRAGQEPSPHFTGEETEAPPHISGGLTPGAQSWETHKPGPARALSCLVSRCHQGC